MTARDGGIPVGRRCSVRGCENQASWKRGYDISGVHARFYCPQHYERLREFKGVRPWIVGALR